MKIYKIAQSSSLLYYVDDDESGITLTPDPFKAEIINYDKGHFPVFSLAKGRFYMPDDLYIDFSSEEIEELKEKGFSGAIMGEDIIIFNKAALRLIGEYDIQQKRIVKK